jgi:hypothetical protein
MYMYMIYSGCSPKQLQENLGLRILHQKKNNNIFFKVQTYTYAHSFNYIYFLDVLSIS